MNKCDGIKILELDPKRILEGNEYMVIAEKDQNFKAPINQIVDLVVSDDRLKNYIDTTIESSIGDFKNEVNQSISELTSIDGTEALIHEEIFNEYFPPVMLLSETDEDTTAEYPFPLLDEEDITNSPEWSDPEQEII